MRAPKIFQVRRFCPPGTRPDCFEIYDTRDGSCASFGGTRKELEKAARTMNEEHARSGRYSRGPEQPTDLIARLFESATDLEVDTLDDLCRRAGIIWDCHRCGFANRDTSRNCCSCDETRPVPAEAVQP